MSSKTAKHKLKLWFSDNRCRKCGCKTILCDDQRLPDNAATIEHIFPSGHPRRKENIITLYCNKCNQKSGDYFLAFGILYHFALPHGVPMKRIYNDTRIARSPPSLAFVRFYQKHLLKKVTIKLSLVTSKLILSRRF